MTTLSEEDARFVDLVRGCAQRFPGCAGKGEQK